MSTTPPDKARRSIWTRTSAIILLLAFCMGTVAGMAWVVLRQIDELSTANSDNLQWSLAQADVEVLQLELALRKAIADPAQLGEVRRRFDVFYSRIGTLERGDVFRTLRSASDFSEPHGAVRAFLDDTVPLIDGDDAQLIAALPDLAAQVADLAGTVRELSLFGLATFARVSDSQRSEITGTLIRLSIILAGLLAGLSLLTYSFRRLYRTAERHAHVARSSEARVRAIVEAAVDAIIVCDEAGAIVDMNEAARRLFGYTREQALGRRALDLYFPEGNHDELRAGPLRVFDNGRRPAPEERLFETLGTDASGRVFPVEVSMDRTDDDAEVIYVAHIRDISHRKAAEEDLTEARDKALAGERAKAEFLALMSHEMRTPLNGLLGTMQLMRDHSLTERQTDLLDHMQSSGRLLLGLVNDVLDLEKFEAGKLTAESRPFSVSRLLDAVVETTAALATQGGNEIAWSWLGTPEDRVLGDTRRLRQVLLNLVGNAIKFTRAGSIDIEVERLGGAAEMVEFRVVDTGVGIAPEHLERIFNDFETLDSSYSRRAGGTGLGLGIARRLVGLMGGTIGVESEPGAGSLFWIRVPLPRVDQVLSGADAPATLVTETAAGEPLEVLLVEDNEINRFVARAMLESDGHVVTEAVNGQAGVEWAEARAFDVILMDVSMPVMDGQEATRRIRAGAGPSAATPIIAVTAHALPEEVARFREAGMDDCISKPIDRAALVKLLRGIRGAEANEGEPVPDDASPVLDEAQLADLLETLGPEATGRLISRCVTEVDASIARLAGTDPGDAELSAAAHKCAGSCASFGLVRLREALGRIETGANSGGVTSGDLGQLGELWQEGRAALLAWQARSQT